MPSFQNRTDRKSKGYRKLFAQRWSAKKPISEVRRASASSALFPVFLESQCCPQGSPVQETPHPCRDSAHGPMPKPNWPPVPFLPGLAGEWWIIPMHKLATGKWWVTMTYVLSLRIKYRAFNWSLSFNLTCANDGGFRQYSKLVEELLERNWRKDSFHIKQATSYSVDT